MKLLKIKKGRKFIGDLSLNLIATAIPIITLQAIIYPIIARNMPEDIYGLMLTVFALLYLISGTFGSGISGMRLLSDEKYINAGVEGDFNVLIIGYGLLTAIIMFFGTWYYEKTFDFFSIALIILASIINMLDHYLEAAFRLKLNYRGILNSKLFLTLGYVVGVALFLVTERWELIYLMGILASFVYYYVKTDLLKEKVVRTNFFKKTFADTTYMQVASLLGRGMSYADKLLLLPLMGGAAVSIYYTANLFGKLVIVAMNPVTNVMLSYLVKIKYITQKNFMTLMIVAILVCTAGYGICLLLSRPVLTVLFPMWVDKAMIYVPITTLALCLNALSTLIAPMTIRYCNIYWQIIINGVSLGIYLLAGLVLFNYYGLMGFCVGLVMAFLVKFIITIGVYIFFKKEDMEI